MTSVAIFYLRHAGFLALCAAAAYGSGRFIAGTLAGVRSGSACEDAALYGGAGLGALGTAIFLLGLIRQIRPLSILALAAVSLVAGAPGLARLGAGLLRRLRRAPSAASLAAALLASPLLLLPLYPPHSYDETMYHLAEAKIYAARHAVVSLPYVRFSFFPQLNEMLFAGALSVGDGADAHLVELLCLLLAGSAAAGLGGRIFSPRAGGWAALLWMAGPAVLVFGTTAHVEAGVALFGTLAVAAAARDPDASDPRAAAASGAFAGLAAATKYMGLFFPGVLFLVYLGRGIRKKRWAAAGLFAAAALLAGAPWYLRTYLLTGSPVFPFGTSVFGPGPWTAEDHRLLEAGLAAANPPASLPAFASSLLRVLFCDRLLGLGPSLGPAGYLLLPLALWGVRRRPGARPILAVVAVYLGFWLATYQNPRFLIPILPLAAVLAAGGIGEAVEWVESRFPGPGRAAQSLVPVALLVPAFLWAVGQVAADGFPPARPGAAEAYLEERLPAYPCYQYLNRERGSAYRVLAWNDEQMNYFADGTRIGDRFGPGRYSDLDLRGGEALETSLRRVGAGWLMVTQCPRASCLPGDAAFRSRFRLACEGPGVFLYELVPGGGAGAPR